MAKASPPKVDVVAEYPRTCRHCHKRVKAVTLKVTHPTGKVVEVSDFFTCDCDMGKNIT